MKYLFKIVLLSIIGFFTPLIILLTYANKFLNVPLFEMAEIREPVSEAVSTTDSEYIQPQTANLTENSGDVLNVKSDEILDPSSESFFIASAYFKMSSPPRQGRRQKLISKYVDDKNAQGWAVALKKNATSIRPEVYWKGDNSKTGGWYTFDNFNIKRNKWYSLTLVAKSSDLISLYVEEMPNNLLESEENKKHTSGPQFLGGYSVADVNFQKTSSPLEFPPAIIESSEFRGELRNVVIAYSSDKLNTQKKIMKLISGGSLNMANSIDSKNIALIVGEDGKDRGPYKRAVESKVQKS